MRDGVSYEARDWGGFQLMDSQTSVGLPLDRRDNFLDCIRALAATLVLFTHYRGWMPGESIGVSIFFCLSGFLICRILIDLPNNSLPNIGKFVFRRFMRVWPLMAFQMFVVLGLMEIFHPDDVSMYASSISGLITFTGGYHAWVGLSPALLWTLRAEFWFYVLFAVALYFAGRQYLLGVIIADIVVSWPAQFIWGHLGAAPFTLIYLDQLMIGALCAYVLTSPPSWLCLLSERAVLWTSLAALGLLATIPFTYTLYSWVWYVQTSAAALCTAVLLLHHAANPVRAELGPLVTIGRISYSIYLMHGVVLDTVTSTHIVNPQFDAVLIFGMIVGISLLTHRYVELPFIQLSKRIARFDGSKHIAVRSSPLGRPT